MIDTDTETKLFSSASALTPDSQTPIFRRRTDRGYNTLDFPRKIVCQKGCYSPLWKPRVKKITVFNHLCFFFSFLICQKLPRENPNADSAKITLAVLPLLLIKGYSQCDQFLKRVVYPSS